MITPSLRLAAIAAVLVASLSLRAAAESDAAFAASLGEAPAWLATAAQKAEPQKPAEPQAKAPSAPEAVWTKILDTVKKDGKHTPGNGRLPDSFSIEDSTGDPKGAHATNNIAVLGMINDDELFEAMGVILVAMEYTLDPKDGNWRIDQWMFQTDIYGDVLNAGHGVVIKSPDGKVVSAVPERLNPADPKIQAQYDSMLKHWAERKP